MKFGEILLNDSVDTDSTDEYRKAGVFIFDDPDEFLEVMSQLQKAYLTSMPEGVNSNE